MSAANAADDFASQYKMHYAIVLDCIMYSEADYGIRKCLDQLYFDNKNGNCDGSARAEECRAQILNMIKISWIDCDHEVLLKSVNWICDNLR